MDDMIATVSALLIRSTGQVYLEAISLERVNFEKVVFGDDNVFYILLYAR